MEFLRESDIPALVRLKAEYDPVGAKFHADAMALVQEALKGKGIDFARTEAGTAGAKYTCGFCSICITDCATCVFGAPRAN
jgi:hypothetical protein